MNKKEIVIKFKKAKTILREIKEYRSNEDIKKSLLKQMKDLSIPEETLKETETCFEVGSQFVLKTKQKKVETITKLPYDVVGKNIKTYGDSWIETEYALYKIQEGC